MAATDGFPESPDGDAGGRTLVEENEFPRGHAGNPMSDAEVEAKFRRQVEPRYGRATADRVLSACWELEKVKNPRELTSLLGNR